MTSPSSWLRRGQTLTEYALAIMLIAIVALGVMTALGGTISSPFAATASSIEAAGGPLPSAAAGGPTAGEPELVCATGFAPGSEVTVNFNPVGASLVSGGEIATLTADGSGEVCEEIPVPVDAPDGDYEFELIGEDGAGDPVTVTKPAITVDGQSFDMSVPATPPEASTGVGTMRVRVRSCSAIYHRENATMNSAGYLLYPGYEFTVYATNGWWDNSFTETITGGTWPAYTCDGGSDNTWYQLTDGSGYVFTGGVDIVAGSYSPPSGAVLFSENFDADNTPAGWSSLATSSLVAGQARTSDNVTALSPEFAVTPGHFIALTVDTKDNSGSAVDYIGLCFRATSGAAVNVATDCTRVATDTGGFIEQVAGAFAPSGMSFATVYFSGNQFYDNVVVTDGITTPTTPLATADFATNSITDQGYDWPGGWEATTGTGGTGGVAGSTLTSRWWAIGPNKTVTLTIDSRRSGGLPWSPHLLGLQVGMPGDAVCSTAMTAPCTGVSVPDGAGQATYTVTVTTGPTAQYVRFVTNDSLKMDNVDLRVGG